MSLENKVIITAALTGAMTPKEMNPNIPLTPEEIAEDAYQCWKAGAAVVHLHMRDDEGLGTMDKEKFKKTIELIKERTDCDVVINCTTSGDSRAGYEERMAHLDYVKPEIASFDSGSFNWMPFGIFDNSPQFLEPLGLKMKENGIKPEIEIFDSGFMNVAKYYIKKEVLATPCHFQFVLGVLGGMEATVRNLQYLCDMLPEGATWSAFGLGKQHMPIMYATLALGGHLRVGLEDNVFYSKGELATNVMLVERAARAIREFGKEPASPDEARQILGLKKIGGAPMYKNYEDLKKKKLDRNAPPKRALLAGANDDHALEAIFAAQEEGFAFPVLIGDESEVADMVSKLGFSDRPHEIVHCNKESNPSELAVRLIHEGKGDFIMKGKMETKDLLKPVLNKEKGLNSKGFITHFGLMEIQDYHKLLAMSDSAVIPYPTLEDKKKIIQVGMECLRKLGYIRPIVGALCAVETVNEKMPETVEAKSLQDMSEEGIFGEGVVVGPISYDLATRKESALIKGYDSPYAGDVDMLLVDKMVTGNVMSKIWNGNPDNILAGCLVGADVPHCADIKKCQHEGETAFNTLMQHA